MGPLKPAFQKIAKRTPFVNLNTFPKNPGSNPETNLVIQLSSKNDYISFGFCLKSLLLTLFLCTCTLSVGSGRRVVSLSKMHLPPIKYR